MYLNKSALRIVSIILIHAFLVSGMSFAMDASDFALAPPLATKSQCEIINGISAEYEIAFQTQNVIGPKDKFADDLYACELINILKNNKEHLYTVAYDDGSGLPSFIVRSLYDMCGHLLANSFDAIVMKGNKEGFKGKITADIYLDKEDVVITITDNGIGVKLSPDGLPEKINKPATCFGSNKIGISIVLDYL